MAAHIVQVVNVDKEFGGGGLAGRPAQDTPTPSESQFGKHAREFLSDTGAQRRLIGTRDYVTKAICSKL